MDIQEASCLLPLMSDALLTSSYVFYMAEPCTDTNNVNAFLSNALIQ